MKTALNLNVPFYSKSQRNYLDYIFEIVINLISKFDVWPQFLKIFVFFIGSFRTTLLLSFNFEFEQKMADLWWQQYLNTIFQLNLSIDERCSLYFFHLNAKYFGLFFRSIFKIDGFFKNYLSGIWMQYIWFFYHFEFNLNVNQHLLLDHLIRWLIFVERLTQFHFKLDFNWNSFWLNTKQKHLKKKTVIEYNFIHYSFDDVRMMKISIQYDVTFPKVTW